MKGGDAIDVSNNNGVSARYVNPITSTGTPTCLALKIDSTLKVDGTTGDLGINGLDCGGAS